MRGAWLHSSMSLLKSATLNRKIGYKIIPNIKQIVCLQCETTERAIANAIVSNWILLRAAVRHSTPSSS